MLLLSRRKGKKLTKHLPVSASGKNSKQGKPALFTNIHEVDISCKVLLPSSGKFSWI